MSTFPYQRVIVFGSTGMGKTTLVRQISHRFALPVVDMDELNTKARNSSTPDAAFVQLANQYMAEHAWIMDGSYSVVQHITWPRAEALIWLDYPVWTVIAHLIWRSLYRILFRKRPQQPIASQNDNGAQRTESATKRAKAYLQAIFTHRQRRQRYFAMVYAQEHRHLHIIRLCSPKDAARWLALFEK